MNRSGSIDDSVMKQQGAGLEPKVRRAIEYAAKTCSSDIVDFRAYKPRVVTID